LPVPTCPRAQEAKKDGIGILFCHINSKCLSIGVGIEPGRLGTHREPAGLGAEAIIRRIHAHPPNRNFPLAGRSRTSLPLPELPRDWCAVGATTGSGVTA